MKPFGGVTKYIIKLTEKNNKHCINFSIIVATLIPLFLYEIVYNNFFYGVDIVHECVAYATYMCIFNIIIINIVKNHYENKNNKILEQLNRQINILKITEEELRISDRKLKQITENNLDVITTCDIHGNVTSVSGVGFTKLGYSTHEILGKNILDLVHPEDINRIKEGMDKLSSKKEISTVELRYMGKNGGWLWLESIGCFIKEESDNCKIVFSTRNVTARKEAEEALIRNQEKFKTLFNKANDSIIVHEISLDNIEEFPKNKIIEINEVTYKRLGYSKEEILNMKITDLFESLEESDARKFVEQLIKNGEVTFIAYLRAKNGEKVLIENNSSICEIDGKKVVMAIARDLTERIKMEQERKMLNEQVQYEKLKTEFFANISHELKTPINVILAAEQLMWSMLKNGCTEEGYTKLFHYMKMIKQNSLRLIRLVNNLIDITKIDSGYLKPNFSNCNIISVVEDISMSVAAYIENKKINLIFDTDVEEKIIACDEEKIERIILNLLSNSVKFTDPEGSIYVTIKDKGDKVVISVRDTGIGVPMDKKEDIFNRFVQVDKTFSRNREGSGIGLSLVKSLVEMHGGTICLISELNKGSEFIIELPCRIVEYTGEDNCVLRGTQEKIERINIEFSDIYETQR